VGRFLGEIAGRFKIVYQKFVTQGHRDFYRMLFAQPQYPIFFSIQAIWSCYVVHRSTLSKPKSIFSTIKQFILAFAMTFLPREGISLILGRPSTLSEHPRNALGIFLVIFIVMTSSPFDIVYKTVNLMYYVLGLAQGFNQIRLFTTIIRNTEKDMEAIQHIPLALVFTVGDQGIEAIFRPLISGEETRLSNGLTIFFTAVSSWILWLVTHRNRFTQYLGLYGHQLAALTCGFALGMFNASMNIVGTSDPVPGGATPRQAPQTPRHEEPAD
jgi:hypothetical protein